MADQGGNYIMVPFGAPGYRGRSGEGEPPNAMNEVLDNMPTVEKPSGIGLGYVRRMMSISGNIELTVDPTKKDHPTDSRDDSSNKKFRDVFRNR
ncbi:MAG: hypothetical protein QF632_04210 [Candidatus Woesearchaeota archaeon]|nr:hypothetical protein [Candidatus Woesearchaeota archaeon]MDP7323936.1 hypothetical protein [Candidatus Woesearchaeota archaeon]